MNWGMAATAGDADSASSASGIYPPPCEGHGNTNVCPKCMYREYEREVVFNKILSQSDIKGAGGYRFYIPRAHAARFFPPPNGSEVVSFYDVEMKPRPMGFFANNERAYFSGAGWNEFAEEKQLRPGDTVICYEVRCGQSTRFFMIAVSYKDRLQILGAPIN